MSESELGRFIEPVARALLGDPNLHLSSKGELRFGKHGSLAIDIEKGTAYSHEDESGGGTLWLIKREKGLEGKEAFEFLREIGCEVERINGHAEPVKRKIVQTYDYADEDGKLLFNVCRFEPKTFAQRAPDGSWKVRGIRQVPYRLPELMEAIAGERVVFVVEGEKDVGNLHTFNSVATCNAGGAGKWRDEFAEFFRDADVVIIPDNDGAGREHADRVGANLTPVARRVRLLTLPNLPTKGDVSDWIAAGGTAEQFNALVENAPAWAPRFESKLGGMRWSDIGAIDGPQYEWIVENIIPAGEPIMIFGDSGTGKSFSTFYMALCIARGEKFYGANVEQGLVVYVAAEGGKGFTKRKTAYCNYYNLNDQEVPFYLITKKPDFFSSDDGVNLLIAEIESICRLYKVPLRMIVLDTLSAMTPGMNEIASADVSRVRQRLQKVVDAFGVATAFVHHTAKGGTTPRGHGSLTADFETTIHFTTTDIKNVDGLPVHRATGGKQREESKGRSWEFVLPIVVVGTNKWGNPETSCVAVPYLKTRNASVKSWNPNPTEKVFLEALFEALNGKGIPTPASLSLPEAITRVAELEEVRALMRERYLSADDDSAKADNRFRQAFKRAGDSLKAGKVIGFKNPYFWYAGKPIVGMASNVVT